MRVFVTGASGFIGQAVVKELLDSGHRVLGLARSKASAKVLTELGAEVQEGSLEDLESLKKGATASDGVIHLAFIHVFSAYIDNCRKDREAIAAIGSALEGSNRPFIITSGTLMLRHGVLGTERDVADTTQPFSGARAEAEAVALSFASKGVQASVIRLPPTNHGEGDHGFISHLCAVAQEKGESSYLGDGLNRWPAAHRLDTARVFRLAIEKGSAGDVYHAVSEDGIPIKDIAGAIGDTLKIPVTSKAATEAQGHFGFLAAPISVDNPASSLLTREKLGWTPINAGLIADIRAGLYFRGSKNN